MGNDNKISITISPSDKTEINAALLTIKTKLQPYLIALTPDERRALPKVSDKSISFMDKTLSYVNTNPEFAPPYLNVAELSKDVDAAEILNSIAVPLEQILTGLEDTMMLAGSEAYIAALSYYNTAKEAARRDVPNAKSVYEDLRQRFPSKSKKEEPQPAPVG
jgi:hypothetical protein